MDPYDEDDLTNSDVVIRRIDPNEHIVPDQNTGRDRISSKAFSASSSPKGGLSIDVLKLMEKDGVDAEEFVTTPKYTGSVLLHVSEIRKEELWVGYEPVQDNPYHGEVWRQPSGGSFSRGVKRRLQKSASWFVPIPNVDLD